MEAISIQWADKAQGPSSENYGNLPGIVQFQKILFQIMLDIA